jgi:hypothetical protein
MGDLQKGIIIASTWIIGAKASSPIIDRCISITITIPISFTPTLL